MYNKCHMEIDIVPVADPGSILPQPYPHSFIQLCIPVFHEPFPSLPPSLPGVSPDADCRSCLSEFSFCVSAIPGKYHARAG